MEREIDTLVRIIASEGILRARDLVKTYGLRADSVSKIITRLRNKGPVDRRDKKVVLADVYQQKVSKSRITHIELYHLKASLLKKEQIYCPSLIKLQRVHRS